MRSLASSLAILSLLATALAAEETPVPPVDLRYAFEQGATIRTKETVTQTMKLSIAGVDQEFTLEEEMTVSRKVESVTEGRAHIVQKVERIQAKATIPQGGESYDSDKPDSKRGAFTKALAALAGIELAYDVSSRGEVSNVSGLEALAKAYESAGVADSEAQASLVGAAIQQGFPKFPAEPVAEGSGWQEELKTPMAGVGTMVMPLTYGFAGREEVGAKEGSGDVPASPGRMCLRLTLDVHDAKFEGGSGPEGPTVGVAIEKGKGEIWIEEKSGFVLKGSIELVMAVTVEVEKGGTKQTVTQKLNQVQTVEVIE